MSRLYQFGERRTRLRLLTAVLLLMGTVPAPAAPHAAKGPLPRPVFVQQLRKITPDMTAAQVVGLIGRPDDVVTRAEVGQMNEGTDTVWCYGTNGHDTFPTLGRVYFCQGVVTGVAGQAIGSQHDLPRQPTLQRALDAVARGDGGYYSRRVKYKSVDGPDPRNLIRAVNALVPLGREQALAVLREYARATDGGEAAPFDEAGHIAPICEALFGTPADPAYPAGHRPADLDRILVIDGIPLRIPQLPPPAPAPTPPTAGMAFRVLDYYAANHGRMRTRPLTPQVESADEIARDAASHYPAKYRAQVERLVREQVRMLRSSQSG